MTTLSLPLCASVGLWLGIVGWAQVVAAPVETAFSTAELEVRVSPELGRITGWRLHGGPNLLWMREENPQDPPIPVWSGYDNRGGDKLWPLPEKLRPFAYDSFVPSPEIDGPAWSFRRGGERTGTLESPASRILGVVVEREVTLAENPPVLTLRNTLRRVSPSPFPVHAWSVTQIRRPRYFIMESRDDLFPGIRRYYRYRGGESASSVEEAPTAIKLGLAETDFDKIYSIGRYIAAVHDSQVFVQWTLPPDAASYSEGANLQVYYNSAYAEMEIASPLGMPKPGENLTNVVYWAIFPIESGESTDWRRIVERIEALLRPFAEATGKPVRSFRHDMLSR